MFLSEYLIESGINALYFYNNSDGNDSILKLGPISMDNLPGKPGTTAVCGALLFTSCFSKFGMGNECQISAQVVGDVPELTLRKGI